VGLTLSWLAGFLDGEGCVRLSSFKNKKTERLSFCPWVSITNTDLPTLKAIQAEYGGNLYLGKEGGKHYKGSKNSFVLVWQGKRAIEFLKLIAPYVILKKPQIELMLASYAPRNHVRLSEHAINQRVQLQSQLTDLKNINYCLQKEN